MKHYENNKLPLVSIIMPAYNAETYIGKSIESALGQTYSNFELLIVDDCSKDDTYRVAYEYALQDKRIRVLQNKKNQGVAKSRNYAIKESLGEYVAFLDSDDIWLTEKLEKQIQIALEENVGLIYTSYALVDESGEDVYPEFIVPEKVTFDLILKKNVIGCSTVLLKSEIAKKYLFHMNFYHEDYVLWLECLQAGYIARGVREVLVQYRVSANSKAGNKKKSAVYRYQIYRNYLKFSAIKSHILLFSYALNGLIKYKKKK